MRVLLFCFVFFLSALPISQASGVYCDSNRSECDPTAQACTPNQIMCYVKFVKRMPLLIEYSGDWCHNCTNQAPIVEAIANDSLNRLVVMKTIASVRMVDSNGEITIVPTQAGEAAMVEALPRLDLYTPTGAYDSRTGTQNYDQLASWINNVANGSRGN